MRGGRVVAYCSFVVSVSSVACGGTSHRAAADGAGGTLDISSSGGSSVGGTVSAVGGAVTSASGGVAGTTTSAGATHTAGAEGGAAGEPGALPSGGEGGAAAEGPLTWRLELEIIEPTEQQLEAGEGALFPASSGLVAVGEDGTRALAAASFPGPDLKDGTLQLTEIIAWTKEHGSVSLGQLPGLEPAFNSDAPHQFSVRYWASDYTADFKVVVGSVDGTVVDHAFIWREGEGMKELELPGAPDRIVAHLSDDGEIVTVVATDRQQVSRTYRFDSSGRSELGTLPGYDGLEATYVIWSEDLGWQQIKGAAATDNAVRFLSQDGTAAIGTSYSTNQIWRWDSTQGATVLSLPAGLTYHELTSVTDDANLALVELETGYRRIPYAWTANGDLATLPAPAGGPWPTARAMTADASRILGWVTAADGHNVLWVDERPYYLEQLFAQSGIDVSGYKNMYADNLSRDGHLLTGSFETYDFERVSRAWFVRLP